MAGSKAKPAKPLPKEPKKNPTGNSAEAKNLPTESAVEELFTRLDGLVKNREYSKVVKLSDEILSTNPNDRDAIHCKIVALIQTGNLDEASKVVKSAEKSNLYFSLENAYCLYRENKLKEALSVLDSVSDPKSSSSPSPSTLSAALQLEAQIRYRMGDSKGCISCYEKISKNGQVSLTSELSTNLLAAYVAAERGAEIRNLMKSLKLQPRESFDIAYNNACGLVQIEDYASAEEMLLLAKRVGEEILIDEEYNESEIEDTLSPITVQLAYVLQMQGKTSEAQEAYGSYFRKKTSDFSSSCVAINNFVALKAGKDALDGLKKFDKILNFKKGTEKTNQVEFKDNLENKLSMKQKQIVLFNRFLLCLHANKIDDAKEMLPSLKSFFADGDLTPLLLSVSLLLKENKITEAIKLMENEDSLSILEDDKMQVDLGITTLNENESLTKHLLHAHVYVLGNLYLEAARVLESVENFKFKPALISIIIALKEKGGDDKGLEDYLDSTVKFFEQKMESEGKEGEKNAEMRHRLFLLAAKHKYKRENYQEAAKLYEKILYSSSSSKTLFPSAVQKEEALHGLILCYTIYDSSDVLLC